MKEVYETALLKTSQTYRQYARKLTLLVSILVVLAFNIDSIAIFKDLANNPEDAAIVAEMAENYLAANDSLDLGASDESIAELNSNYKTCRKLSYKIWNPLWVLGGNRCNSGLNSSGILFPDGSSPF